MKNAVYCNVTPCDSYMNRLFGGTYRLHHQDDIVFLRSVLRLLVIADVVPSLLMLFTLMMGGIMFFRNVGS
jgi:hypothetical protein